MVPVANDSCGDSSSVCDFYLQLRGPKFCPGRSPPNSCKGTTSFAI